MESSSLSAMDVALFRAVNTKLAGPIMDQVMLAISSKWTWIAAGAIVVGYAIVRRRAHLFAFCLLVGITMGISDGFAYQVLKPTFARERPCHQFADVRLVQDRCGSDFGFPSNHAANAMAVAVLSAWIYRRHRVVAVFFTSALLVGLSRVYLGVHFPGDVTAGFVVGSIVATATYFLYRATVERWIPVKARP